MKSTFLLLYFVLGTVVYAQDRLERIAENGKTGWRFSTSDPAKHGDIGTEAVDISHSTLTTPYIGAVGDYSFVTGLNNYASGRYSFASGKLTHASGLYSTAMGHATKAEGYTTFAIGNYNAADTSPQQGIFTSTNTAFVIGNGTAQNARSNAFKVLFDGTTTIAGEVTATKFIGDGSELTNLPSSQTMTEEITENGNTGWRLTGADPDNYGDIGNGAIDLSVTDEASSTYGATGDFSFVRGLNATASGEGSTSWGANRTSSVMVLLPTVMTILL